MKIFDLDKQFILGNIDQLIELEDYVPFDFREYGFQSERDKFLESKRLLKTMREMDKLVQQKCNHAENSVKAHNSVLIEWLDFHPEFEDMISVESQRDYQYLKQNKRYIGFIEFLYSVKLPSENIPKKRKSPSRLGFRDDSAIQLPDFDKIQEIYLTYPNTLLADYLSYLV